MNGSTTSQTSISGKSASSSSYPYRSIVQLIQEPMRDVGFKVKPGSFRQYLAHATRPRMPSSKYTASTICRNLIELSFSPTMPLFNLKSSLIQKHKIRRGNRLCGLTRDGYFLMSSPRPSRALPRNVLDNLEELGHKLCPIRRRDAMDGQDIFNIFSHLLW